MALQKIDSSLICLSYSSISLLGSRLSLFFCLYFPHLPRAYNTLKLASLAHIFSFSTAMLCYINTQSSSEAANPISPHCLVDSFSIFLIVSASANQTSLLDSLLSPFFYSRIHAYCLCLKRLPSTFEPVMLSKQSISVKN